MSKISFLNLTILALLVFSFTSQAEDAKKQPSPLGQVMPAFELKDMKGQPHKLADLQDKKGVAILFLGTECPLAKMYGPRFQELAQKYESQGIAFLGISSNQQDSLSELATFAREHQLSFPLLKDLRNAVADAFHAERTPEIFLLNAERKVIYHGRIDDQYTYGIARPKVERQYLMEAIDALLAGKKVEIAETEVVGCHIGRVLTADETCDVTYSKQIARIFQARCVECHRTGDIGPFPLTNYEEVVGWAEMIREVVELNKMPPWHANPKHGHFANDARLTVDEKDQIYRWVEAGAPRGNPADLPPPRTFNADWRIGKPDAIFAMSETPFNVPAKGEVRYQFYTIDPGFTEDKWIQEAECQPGNRSVVHHIIVGIVPPNGSRKSQGSLHSEWLCATAPGARPLVLPEGYAKFVPAGSKLIFQMHYTPNGKAQTDRSFVGFKFADPATVKKQVGTDKAANPAFLIPPNTKSHPVKAVKKFDADANILTMFPHMHLRGCSFRYTLQYADGREEILLDVPHFDFNWQNGYELTTPKFVPAGTKLICDATFDNSTENLANPNPNQAVRWGDQTWEEMMIGYFDMTLADQDLTKQDKRRTDNFQVQARAGNIRLPEELRQQAAGALASPAKFTEFGVALRTTVPQLDRICWTTAGKDKLTVEQVAQEGALSKKIPAANASQQVDLRLSKLAGYAVETKPQVHRDLATQTPFDLHYMAKAFHSSVHVPATYSEKKGTINFWSVEKDAFSPEAVELLTQVAELLTVEKK